jgi:hypothetical protein
MGGLDWNKIETAILSDEPFAHVVISGVLSEACGAAVAAEYPVIRSSGSYSLADAPPGPVLASIIADLLSERFRTAMERLFDVDLAGRPASVTLRGRCAPKDGQIHTDSKTKILSLLLYLNPQWPREEGQLRLLRSGADLEDFAVQIPATLGTMLIFARSDTSWHGHTAFAGERRVLQLNYLQTQQASLVGQMRHRLSAFAKHAFAE